MAVIREQDLGKGRAAFEQWQDAAHNIFSEQLPADDDAAFDFRLNFSPRLPRQLWAMAVRYSLYLLEKKAPGEGVEVRVAPWGAIKILDGPASDPHNLTPPDVIELDPDVWMRLATGITSWDEEKDAGRITAVGERDDLSGCCRWHRNRSRRGATCDGWRDEHDNRPTNRNRNIKMARC